MARGRDVLRWRDRCENTKLTGDRSDRCRRFELVSGLRSRRSRRSSRRICQFRPRPRSRVERVDLQGSQNGEIRKNCIFILINVECWNLLGCDYKSLIVRRIVFVPLAPAPGLTAGAAMVGFSGRRVAGATRMLALFLCFGSWRH